MPFAGKIAVIGSGSVGGYYGGRLARHGAEVAFLARRDLAAWRRHGLRVRSTDGDFTVQPVKVFGNTAEMGPQDLVIIAVKATANAALRELLPPLLHPGTKLLTFQNGLGNDTWLAGQFGAERVMGGLCFVCINRDEDGVIHHLGQGNVSLGNYRRPPDTTLDSVVALFKASGIPARAAPDLEAAQWRKLVWNVPFNGLAVAMGGLDCAQILAAPDGEARARALMGEVIAAAAALGHPLPPDLIDQQVALTKGMGPYRPSSLVDFLDGKPVELEAIWGEPMRQAMRPASPSPACAGFTKKSRR